MTEHRLLTANGALVMCGRLLCNHVFAFDLKTCRINYNALQSLSVFQSYARVNQG